MAINLLIALQAEQYDDAQTILDALEANTAAVIAAGTSPAIHELMGDISKLRRKAYLVQPAWNGLQAMETMIARLETASDAALARLQATQPFPWPTRDTV